MEIIYYIVFYLLNMFITFYYLKSKQEEDNWTYLIMWDIIFIIGSYFLLPKILILIFWIYVIIKHVTIHKRFLNN